MATVNSYSLRTETEVVPVTLTASDDAVVDLQGSASLVIGNATGGDLTINIIGAGATTAECPGVGTIDLSSGKDFSVTDGTTKILPLNAQYQKFLGDGNLTITGGTGATAYIITS